MKLGILTVTYKRPNLLGRAVHCFLSQTYHNAEMVILDDAGAYRNGDWMAKLIESGSGLSWRIVSQTERYPDLGTKRAACVDMFSPEVDAIVLWDDDDVFMPNALACHAKALEEKPWSQAQWVYERFGDNLGVVPAFGKGSRQEKRFFGYGGCWSFRMKEYREIGGYRPTTKESRQLEDLDIAHRFFDRYGPSANSTPTPADCFYYYNRDTWKISDEGLSFWEKRADYPMPEIMPCPPIAWNGPNMYEIPVLPGIQPRPF